MSEWNPVSVEREIGNLTNDIAKTNLILGRTLKDKKDTARAYKRAYASAYLAHQGPQAEKKQAAEIDPEVEAAALARDVAELAHADARNLLDELSKKLEAMRTISASVRQAYANAGRGDW